MRRWRSRRIADALDAAHERIVHRDSARKHQDHAGRHGASDFGLAWSLAMPPAPVYRGPHYEIADVTA